MKKSYMITLLAGAVLIGNAQQNSRFTGVSGKVNMAEKLAAKYAVLNNPKEKHTISKPVPSGDLSVGGNNEEMSALTATPSASWQAIGGSMNIYGVLSSQNRPLNYNDNLNAVTFIHRKGNTSITSPADNSGSMMARVSTNWGQSWDSTCFWSNNTWLARYPQGGIYNPPGNSSIGNAYIVGMGPATDGNAWTGSWYASKQLGQGNYNFTASPAPGAQQYIANTPPFAPGLAKHDFPRPSFSATDDGFVRTLGNRYYGYDNGQGAPTDFRGAAIVKGSFNAGTFTWTSDTIMPNFVTRTNGSKQAWDQPVMAWDEIGNVGYVMFIGAAATATGSNKGWQPIIYKTTNGGSSWAQIQGIDFNSPSFAPVKNSIAAVNVNPTLEVPFFKIDEGYDVSVDMNGKLHILSTLVGTSSQHNDSLEYTYQFGTQGYNWPHTPGARPYIYDFIGDGNGPWNYVLIDSMSSESPGSVPAAPGYTDNPWDIDAGSKVTSDARLQLSRTFDGQYIVYSWAESDTNFTNAQVKWNVIPNIKVRAMITGTSTVLSTTEVNLTKPTPAIPGFQNNTNVVNRAMFHFMSPTCLFVTCLGSGATSSVQIRIPFTVSNSNPYSQLTENRHWFTGAKLDFLGLNICTGLQQHLGYDVSGLEVFPNPSNGNLEIRIDLEEKTVIEVSVHSMIGQKIYDENIQCVQGRNEIPLQFNGISKGVYIMKVKTGKTESCRKIIIE